MSHRGRRSGFYATVLACSVLGCLLLLLAGRQAQAQESLLVTITDAIAITDTYELQLYVTVSSADGRPVPGLHAETFRLLEKPSLGESREIVTFTVQTESELRAAAGEGKPGPPPLSIALTIDTSESMRGVPLAEAKAAASAFVESRPEKDEIALFAFSSDVRLLQDFTPDKSAVRTAIDGLEAGGTTALYEAVHRVSESLARRPQRRRFVMLTDGQNDTTFTRTRQQAIDAAKRAEAPAYMLGFGTTLDTALEPIARETGGRYLVRPRPDEIRGLFDDVQGLLDQYVLTYVPRVESEETKYRVTVEVKADEAVGSDFLFVVVPPATPAPVEPTATPTPPPPTFIEVIRDTLPWSLILIALGVLGLWGWLRGRSGQELSYDGHSASNDARVCPNCKREMDDDWVDCLFCVRKQTGAEATEEAHPSPLRTKEAPHRTKELPPAEGGTMLLDEGAAIVVEGGPHAGMGFELNRASPARPRGSVDTLIGRATDNDIVFDRDPTVSRHHALVKYRDGVYEIHNWSRTQPLLVNGRRVTGVRLQEGDRVTLGRTVIAFMELGAGQ